MAELSETEIRQFALEELLARGGAGLTPRQRERLVFPDHGLLQSKELWRREADEFLARMARLRSEEELFAALFDESHCPYDLPGIAHGLLHRWEEHLDPRRDEHGRWPAKASLLAKHGLLGVPIVDLMARALHRAVGARGESLPMWKTNDWAVALTFDIDSAAMLRGARTAASSCRRLLSERGVPAALRGAAEAVAVNAKLRADPHENLEWLGDQLAGEGVRATFFVQAVRAHRLDNYELKREPELILALRRLRLRGHEIGLHGSYLTASRDAGFLLRQKQLLESMIGGEVTLHRHHYLRTIHPENAALYARAAFRADCSLGFAEREGFRLGTSFPVRVPGKELFMVPMHVMDVTLRYHRRLPPEEAFNAATEVMSAARRVSGLCVLLWHPHNMEPRLWAGWEELPFELVKWAKMQGARVDGLESLLNEWANREKHEATEARRHGGNTER